MAGKNETGFLILGRGSNKQPGANPPGCFIHLTETNLPFKILFRPFNAVLSNCTERAENKRYQGIFQKPLYTVLLGFYGFDNSNPSPAAKEKPCSYNYYRVNFMLKIVKYPSLLT